MQPEDFALGGAEQSLTSQGVSPLAVGWLWSPGTAVLPSLSLGTLGSEAGWAGLALQS